MKFNPILPSNCHHTAVNLTRPYQKPRNFGVISLGYYYNLLSQVKKSNTLVSLLLLSMIFHLNRGINIADLGQHVFTLTTDLGNI